jgi:2-polyprenyl-6-methoxyphenol hydroxylase-like FAD-dependent oxidoreductase
MRQVRSIAIVGGGLAGLAVANGLAAFGFEMDVFEQAPSLAEIGAGINISSQAVKALCAIGLGEKLAAVANTHPGTLTRDMHTGEQLEFRDTRALIGDAAHAMLPNAGQGACQAFEDAYILARWLEAARDPVEAFDNFRRIRIPRVHAIQRLSFANAQFKHMRDSAAQKAMITSGKRGVLGNAEWVWGYDPVGGWDKEPTVPTIE